MRDYIALFKLRIVALLLFVALVSAVTASRGELQPGRFLILFAGGALASVGASILNHYFDRDIDALSDRTRRRPIPAGRVAPHRACWLGILLVAAAIFISSRLNYLTALYILAGALVYVVVYTIWLKRRSVLNIVIGGAAGSCAVLAGYAAMEGNTSLAAVLAALLVFLWTPPHFWAFAIVHKRAYQQAAVPMLPVVHGDARAARLIMMHTILLVQASLLLYALGYFGVVYLTVAVLFGLAFVAFNIKLMMAPSKMWAWRSYKFSGIYLIAIFAGMLLDIVFKLA
ncbi:MAG: protoheme IX farnesyltransferase [Euryarchaeota archaeon]|nr:protoheme IX farnesyltransferase [Euryarchaeota archaeon]